MRINDKEQYQKIQDSITMKNLRTIIDSKGYLIQKVASNSLVSDSSISAYITGDKRPSVAALISLANFLDCNIDFLLDRTNNPVTIDKLNELNNNPELNQLFNNILSLPKDKQELVKAYVQGILNS